MEYVANICVFLSKSKKKLVFCKKDYGLFEVFGCDVELCDFFASGFVDVAYGDCCAFALNGGIAGLGALLELADELLDAGDFEHSYELVRLVADDIDAASAKLADIQYLYALTEMETE